MSKTITPFDTRDRFTPIHNYVIDHMMPALKPNAFKALVFIIRKTKGWGKDADRISYSQLRKGTGIASDSTLSAALQELEALRYIFCEKQPGLTNNYILNTTLEIVEDSDPSRNCSGTSTETVVPTSTETVDTKETTTKETNKRKRVAKATPTPPAPAEPSRDEEKVIPSSVKATALPPLSEDPPVLTEQQEWFAVACAIVGWDSKTIGPAERGQVAQTLGIIRKAGYTLDELKQFLPNVWHKDWRWTKNQSFPTLSQLRTEIGKVRVVQPSKNFVPPVKPEGGSIYGKFASFTR